ncbi:hemerythrin domain-containing protein [Pseudoduganella violaceinigra]|uniref:hemerythrin domain-containing protein n=1 Tax=Pseudoduganella violaceinigra TaxID=246602 RepID=UPI001378FB80|nr:hemerythrin domain-containing protein [Pseudoduganella violaceinigra]
MQRLEWSPLLETGVAEMDASHRSLLQAIHATIDADDSSLSIRIAELLNILALDFAEEEALMDQLYYPTDHEHRAAHRRALAALQHALPVAQENPAGARILLERLPRWFLGHLSAMDLPLAVAVENTSHPHSQPSRAKLRQQLSQLLQEQRSI